MRSLGLLFMALSALACLSAAAMAQDSAPLAAQSAEASAAEADAVDRERERLVARLERLKREAAVTQDRSREIGEELVDLAADDAKLRQRLEEAAERVGAIEERILANEDRLAALTDEQARLRHTLQARRGEVATVLMALQRLGRSPPPALAAGDAGTLGAVRGAILFNAMLPQLDAKARALVALLHDSKRLEDEERDRWTRLRSDLSKVGEERARLDALAEELDRRRTLSSYERDRTVADLARLAEETGTVESLLAKLTQEGADAEPEGSGFAERRGKLPVPVAGNAISRYGDVTSSGDLAEGMTLAALPEATVLSPMAGKVLFAGPFRSFGHVLIVDAGDGYHMVLAGMEESFVSPGESIGAGVPLGRMGRSRRGTKVATVGVEGSALLGARPALYVELRKDGSAIDSQGWWRRASVDGGRIGG